MLLTAAAGLWPSVARSQARAPVQFTPSRGARLVKKDAIPRRTRKFLGLDSRPKEAPAGQQKASLADRAAERLTGGNRHSPALRGKRARRTAEVGLAGDEA